MIHPRDTRWRLLTALALVALSASLLAGCAGDDPVLQEETTMADDHEDGDGEMSFHFGEPADPADADRVIEIEASDAFAFDPAEITVSVGETVTFRVTNVGAIPHDFTLGDEEMQNEHEAEMAEMAGGEMMMHDEPNAMAIEPGETAEMTWHFTAPGEILMGCHQPGHYPAGMVGTITVEG